MYASIADSGILRIPKSLRLDIIIMKGGSQYGAIQQITIKLGTSQIVEYVVEITPADVTVISSGGSIAVFVEVVATPVYFGIPLNFATQDLGSTDISIP